MDLSMGPHFSITSASLSAFDTIAIIILIPFYDRILIPFLSRYNLQPTYLQRVGIGLVVSSAITHVLKCMLCLCTAHSPAAPFQVAVEEV